MFNSVCVFDNVAASMLTMAESMFRRYVRWYRLRLCSSCVMSMFDSQYVLAFQQYFASSPSIICQTSWVCTVRIVALHRTAIPLGTLRRREVMQCKTHVWRSVVGGLFQEHYRRPVFRRWAGTGGY